MKQEKVYWLENAPKDGEPYEGSSTYYRCVGIESFVKKVEEKWNIVGITFEDNNLGFVITEK